MENLQTEKALLIWREDEIIKDQWILDDSQAEITIGRLVDCTITIPVRWISRTHALLRREKGQFALEDAGSKNGVFVNGQRVAKSIPLNDGDIIQLAPGLELIYVDSEATAPLPGRKGLGLQIDAVERQVYIHGRLISPALSTQQYQLLVKLCDQPGKVYSRSEAIAAAWPDVSADGVTDDAVDALIRRLRQRLTEVEPEHNFIVTLRGYGFRLDNDVS